MDSLVACFDMGFGRRSTRIAYFAPSNNNNFAAMRSEILQRIQALLQNEDLEAIRKDVRTEIESFRSLIQDDFRAQREAWDGEEHEDDEKFQFQPSPEEIEFNGLVDQFKEREKAWRQRRRARLRAPGGCVGAAPRGRRAARAPGETRASDARARARSVSTRRPPAHAILSSRPSPRSRTATRLVRQSDRVA